MSGLTPLFSGFSLLRHVPRIFIDQARDYLSLSPSRQQLFGTVFAHAAATRYILNEHFSNLHIGEGKVFSFHSLLVDRLRKKGWPLPTDEDDGNGNIRFERNIEIALQQLMSNLESQKGDSLVVYDNLHRLENTYGTEMIKAINYIFAHIFELSDLLVELESLSLKDLDFSKHFSKPPSYAKEFCQRHG